MSLPRSREKAGMAFIFTTLLIDVIGFGIVIPIIPTLIGQLVHPSAHDLVHKNPAQISSVYGWLLASYGLMQFLFSPVVGNLSDKFGRRPVLLASLFFNGLDYIVMAVAGTIGLLFVSRILSGIAGASFTTGSAYIADVSPPEKRAQNFGLIGAAFGIGFVLGPLIGGELGHYFGVRAPFIAAAILCLGNFLYGYFVLPESLDPAHRREFSLKNANPIGSVNLLGRERATLLLGFVFLLTGLAQQGLQSIWVLYTQYRYNWGPDQVGISLAVVGIVFGGVQAGLTRVIVPKLGETRSVLIGFTISIIGNVLFGLVSVGWLVYPTIVIWGLAGIANPALQAIMSKSYGPSEQGAMQGALVSIQSFSGVIAPIIATALFGFFTAAGHLHLPGITFFYGAGLMFLSLILVRAAMIAHEHYLQRVAEREELVPVEA